jgi:hypothetical protein
MKTEKRRRFLVRYSCAHSDNQEEYGPKRSGDSEKNLPADSDHSPPGRGLLTGPGFFHPFPGQADLFPGKERAREDPPGE